MRYVFLILLAGCSATKMPTTKEGAQPGDMTRDWNACYGNPYTGLLLGGQLGKEIQRRDAVECMRAKGWK